MCPINCLELYYMEAKMSLLLAVNFISHIIILFFGHFTQNDKGDFFGARTSPVPHFRKL